MSVQEELEVELNHLRNKRDDLEEQMRQVSRVLEAEDYNMLCEQRKMDELWNDYGRYAPEMENMLEEERTCIENYRAKFAEYREEIEKEYSQEMENIDCEIEELQKEIYTSYDEKEESEGDIQDGYW